MATVALVVAVAAVAAVAQQRDVSKPPAALRPDTAGVISGIVRTSDESPQPIRRALVTIAGGELGSRPRSAMTGDDGRFSFGGLPAGRYTLTARKAAWLQSEYGALRPLGAGTPVALGAGEKLDLTLRMFRGAAVSGTVRDAAGQPVSGIDVRVMDVRTLTGPPDNSPVELATSDDRGTYLIFNLPPGEYLLVALPPPGGSNAGAQTAQDVDAALAMLTARTSAAATPAGPVTAPPAPRTVGFGPVFYPGTPYPQQAARVRVGIGEERRGLDIELQMLPFASIEGRITGAAGFDSVQVTLIPTGPRVASGYSTQGMSGRPPDQEGVFGYGGIAPGPYRIVARAQRGGGSSASSPGVSVTGRGGGGGGTPLPPPPGGSGGRESLYAVADLDVRGEDISGLTLALAPGGTIHGRIVVRGSGSQPAPSDLSGISLRLNIEGGGWSMSSDGITMGPGMLGQPAVAVQADGTFTIESIAPGRFQLSGTVPGNLGKWQWRSAVAHDRDLLDSAIELGPGIDLRDVVVTLTDIPTELTGTLQSASGQPTAGYFIVALPAHPALLQPRSRRILWTRPDTSGRFTFSWPPAGEYVLTALTDLDPLDLQDPAFLAQVASAGIKVTVPEGQKTTQDLRIR